MIQQLLPDQLLNNQTWNGNNNAKHTNLLGFEAKEPMNYNGYPWRARK